MLTLENYETVALALAIGAAMCWLIGFGIIKPSNGLKALPTRNRLGLILIMLGVVLICLTFMVVTICYLPLLVPT